MDLVKNRLARYYRTPAGDPGPDLIQRGAVGAVNLNQALRKPLIRNIGLRRGGYLFKPQDKVMQIRNNYDKEVFNGDIGVINL